MDTASSGMAHHLEAARGNHISTSGNPQGPEKADSLRETNGGKVDEAAVVPGKHAQSEKTEVHEAQESYEPNASPNVEGQAGKKGVTDRDVTEENGSSGANTSAADTSVALTEGDGEKGVVNASAEDGEEDDIVYPHGLPLALLTLGLCFATFTVALDNTIIGKFAMPSMSSVYRNLLIIFTATAIPRITTVFDSLGDVGWVSYIRNTSLLGCCNTRRILESQTFKKLS